MVVDWGPHDVPVVLYRIWVVCALSLLRARTHGMEHPQLSNIHYCRLGRVPYPNRITSRRQIYTLFYSACDIAFSEKVQYYVVLTTRIKQR